MTNSGTIGGAGTNSVGVSLGSGGSVTNKLGAAINGGALGVYIKGGSGQVTNSGTIGGKAASVAFEGPGANTLPCKQAPRSTGTPTGVRLRARAML